MSITLDSIAPLKRKPANTSSDTWTHSGTWADEYPGYRLSQGGVWLLRDAASTSLALDFVLRSAPDTINRFSDLVSLVDFSEIVPINPPLTSTVLIKCSLYQGHKS